MRAAGENFRVVPIAGACRSDTRCYDYGIAVTLRLHPDLEDVQRVAAGEGKPVSRRSCLPVLAIVMGLASVACGRATAVPRMPARRLHPATSTTIMGAAPKTSKVTTESVPTFSTSTSTTRSFPPLSFNALPVPSDYTCAPGSGVLFTGNRRAFHKCIPDAYLFSKTTRTACPAGSYMTMGPVMCIYDPSNGPGFGIVAPVPPGPDTCSSVAAPCLSSKLPLSPKASVLPWSDIENATGACPSGYYFGESKVGAACVPYGYLPGGTDAHPSGNTDCPPGSGRITAKPNVALCTRSTTTTHSGEEPFVAYYIVAPIAPIAPAGT